MNWSQAYRTSNRAGRESAFSESTTPQPPLHELDSHKPPERLSPRPNHHPQERRKRWIRTWIQPMVRNLEAYVGRQSLVGNRSFHDATQFPWIAEVEAEWRRIRAELDTVLQYRAALPNFQDISPDVTSIQDDDRWKTWFLYGYGRKVEVNCTQCPETTRIIEAIPGMTTAFFSILAPGKHIPAHRGPYKGVLRYHLGLNVPEPAGQCRIRVADEVRHWREGRSLVFDDTFDHEVWNNTEGERAILFLDVERPLPSPLATLNRLLIRAIGHSPFIKHAQANQTEWTQRLQAAQRQVTNQHRDAEPHRDPETV